MTIPDTIIIDGLTLGTLKDIPIVTPTTVDHITLHVPIQDRVWIINPRVRNSLRKYAKDGLSPQGFTILAVDLDDGPFHDYLVNGNDTVS